MVSRPLSDRRPVGPLMDIDLDRDMGSKIQLGVHGTALPNIRKSPLTILYVLDSHVATLPGDVTGVLRDKIQDKFEGSPQVRAERSGRTSAKPFDEQAIVVVLKKQSLPVQQAEINRAANSIEGHYSDFGVRVKAILMDTR